MVHEGPRCEYLVSCLQAAKRLQKEASSMRKFVILASVVAIVVAALALPALAQDSSPFGDVQDQQNFEQRFDKWQDRAEERDYTEQEAYDYYFDRFAHFYGFGNDWQDDDDDDDRDHWWNDDRRDNDRNDNNNNSNNNNNDEVVPAVSQEF